MTIWLVVSRRGIFRTEEGWREKAELMRILSAHYSYESAQAEGIRLAKFYEEAGWAPNDSRVPRDTLLFFPAEETGHTVRFELRGVPIKDSALGALAAVAE